MADLGTKSTLKVTESLRDKIAERGVSSEEEQGTETVRRINALRRAARGG